MVSLEPWRTADQRYYVSDVRRFSALTGWTPGTTVAEGVSRLASWLSRDTRARPEKLAATRVAS